LEIIFLKKRSGPKNGGKAIDLKQKVEVIRHQHIGVERERVALALGPERPDHGRVSLVEQNLLPIIARGHHVIEQSFARIAGDAASRVLVKVY
jgi:hypothetical protein